MYGVHVSCVFFFLDFCLFWFVGCFLKRERKGMEFGEREGGEDLGGGWGSWKLYKKKWKGKKK